MSFQDLKTWNPAKQCQKDTRFGIIGPTGTGKTVAAMHLIRTLNFDRGIGVCGSSEIYDTFEDCIPTGYLYDYYPEAKLKELISYQTVQSQRIKHLSKKHRAELVHKCEIEHQKWVKHKKDQLAEKAYLNQWSVKQVKEESKKLKEEIDQKQKKQNDEIRKTYNKMRDDLKNPWCMFLIVDDFSSDKRVMKSDSLKTLMDKGRHAMFCVLVLIQHCMDYPPECRDALDWLILFNNPNTTRLRKLYEHYVTGFETFEQFKKTIRDAAKNGGCLVINRRKPGIFNETVFFYKPEEQPLKATRNYFGNEMYHWVNDMLFDEKKYEERTTAAAANDICRPKEKISKKEKQEKKENSSR